MSHRSALNRAWALVSILWIGWCLYWPVYARRQDLRAVHTEAAETYKVCLQQKGLTAADCATDRDAYTHLSHRWAAPPDQNAYQAFAGTGLRGAVSFLAVLSLAPILIGYTILRVVLETVLWFARARPRDLAAGDNRITSARGSLDA